MKRELSGPEWCARFPTSRTTGSLVEPFQSNVERFITVLERAGCVVVIAATRRPEQRAWLMRQAWDIAHGLVRPERVDERRDIPIQWEHPSREASIAAAKAMVDTYRLGYRPSLTSRHIEGKAIDMSITIPHTITVLDKMGTLVTLQPDSTTKLYDLGWSFGVRKLVSDPPHWSSDGR